MMKNRYLTAYYDAVFDTDRDRASEVIRQALDGGVPPKEVFRDRHSLMEKMIGSMMTDSLVTLYRFISPRITTK